MATIIALLIKETQKHHDNLRMQITEGTTQMMNDPIRPPSHTVKRPMHGQHNLAQYKDPFLYSPNQPSYLPDDPLSTPTILQPSLIPLTLNNSPTSSPCPSPPLQMAQMPAPTTAPTHSLITNSWMFQRATNYPPPMNSPQSTTILSSLLPKLHSGAKNKKTKKELRTHGRTLTSSTHGMLTIAAKIPGTVALPYQAVKRLAQMKNAIYQMAIMQTMKEAAMTAPVLPSGISPTAANTLRLTTSSLTSLRSSYLTTSVFDLLANACLLMILPDFVSTSAWMVLLSDSPERSRQWTLTIKIWKSCSTAWSGTCVPKASLTPSTNHVANLSLIPLFTKRPPRLSECSTENRSNKVNVMGLKPPPSTCRDVIRPLPSTSTSSTMNGLSQLTSCSSNRDKWSYDQKRASGVVSSKTTLSYTTRSLTLEDSPALLNISTSDVWQHVTVRSPCLSVDRFLGFLREVIPK